MDPTHEFRDSIGRRTAFNRPDGSLDLVQLCGLECSLNAFADGMLLASGTFVAEGDGGPLSRDDFRLLSCQADATRLQAEWGVGRMALKWESHWVLEGNTGIWSRRDRLVNSSEQGVLIRNARSCFHFPPGEAEFYFQRSVWAHENQGEWVRNPPEGIRLRSQAGRTNQGAAPYLFFHPHNSQESLAFHLLPVGNWILQVHPSGDSLQGPVLEIELGSTADQLELKAGEAFELPEILIQPIPSSRPETGAPIIHRYILERFCSRENADSQTALKSFAPLVYNTWFDTFEGLQPVRLRRQLMAAKEVGCEVFVVDAGWYGNGRGPWDRQVGDWSEKKQAAFDGRMKEFAAEVEAAGLGFGLWMEPERFARGAPILEAQPEWFIPCPYDYFRLDLSQEAAREYLFAEIRRLVETYRLAWMKIDFNLEMDEAADGLAGYYQAWYALLERLRQRFPGTFFEGCASGGMRLEVNSLRHFDGHFLSDTVNPVDMLRITQGALLRVPPGRLTRWAVLRPAEKPGQVIAPEGANWERVFTAEVDFICRAALPGMVGYSGDLAGLSTETMDRLRHHGEFYKKWREFLTGSVCTLLTPVEDIENRKGWAALQLHSIKDSGLNLLFVYRLEDDRPQMNIRLSGLEWNRSYRVTNMDMPEEIGEARAGSELMEAGLLVRLPARFSAGIWIVGS